jgi:hypothetical protein
MALFVRRRWPWWVAAAVAVLALVAGAVWLLGGSDGSPDSSPAVSAPPDTDPTDVGAYETVLTPPVEPTQPTPASVDLAEVLAASDSELKAYDGKTVAANRVNVLRRVSGSAAWVGDDAANRVLVLLVSPETTFAFEAGTRLTFSGTVARATPGTGKQLGLTGAELADFEAQGTYVEVTAFTAG